MREDPQRGCSEIFTMGPDRDGLFALTSARLDQLGINILGARIDVNNQGISVNSYFVLEDDGELIDARRREEVILALAETLNAESDTQIGVARRMPRALKSFVQDTDINVQQDEGHQVTLLTVITHDRPGLLASIGKVLCEQQVRLHRAGIVTEGAVARDTFTLTDGDDQPIIDQRTLDTLKSAVRNALDN